MLRNKPAHRKNWYVFYTKSRSEKKVFEQVKKHDYEAYLPLVKEVRQWSDRKKKVEIPLFRSYIFIECTEHQIPELIQWTPGLVTYVTFNAKPAQIRQEELDTIERFINTGLRIRIEQEESINPGDKVKVIGGALEGMEGEVIELNNHHYFLILVQAIHQYIKVQLPGDFLKRIE